jgi:hypothetical protein
MPRRLAVFCAALLVALLALPLVAVVAPTSADTGGTGVPLTTPAGFNDTTFRVTAFDNGSARWTVEHRRPLDGPAEIDQFETYAERFTGQETEAFVDFRYRARQLAKFGTNATGRGMNASDFSRRAGVEERFGTQGLVAMSFLWSNFSRTPGERVIVGDVFDGGLYITGDQRFVLERGSGLAFSEVSPPDPFPDSVSRTGNLTGSETVTWFGPKRFADAKPSATLVPLSSLAATDDSTPTTTPTGTEPGASLAGSGNGPEMLMVLLGVLLLVGLGGGLAWYSGRIPPGTDASAGGGSSTQAGTETPVEPATPQPESTVSDEELLSDEDRVVQLLDENGGRMKQVKIVEATDWSKSKVSMLLSDMEEEGTISKLRVGRENIISKAGEEPDAVGSPFEDE